MPDTKWTYPDGSSITEHEDGSFTVTEANGAKTHYDDDTGRRTETPAPGAGGQPTVTDPTRRTLENGEIEIRYPDGTRVYIRLNPKRFRIVRSAPAVPRKWEVEMPTGTRNVQQVKDGEITTTPATTPQPESITPSEHPAPATPAPAPPPEGGGSAKPKPKPSKGKKKRKPKKPARKASKAKKKKKKAPRRKR